MVEPTAVKSYEFLKTLLLGVIALSLVLLVIEVQKPKVIEVRCDDKTKYSNEPRMLVYRYYSDGSTDISVNKDYGCLTKLRKIDGTNYPYPAESTTTLP